MVAFSSYAATITVEVPSNTTSNLLTSFSPGCKITAVQITSPANAIARVALVDTPNGDTTYTNAAYVSTTKYATNQVVSWVNYFGATNSYTNISLVSMTVTNSAASFSYPVLCTLSAGTNATTSLTGVNFQAFRGVYAVTDTNGSAMVTITYTQ